MGFSFNFFGEQQHRTFNYKPRYYDPEKEERRRMFGAVDGIQDAKEEKNTADREPGSYIRGSFRNGNYQNSRSDKSSMAQRIIGLVGLLLFFAILYYVIRFYALILK